MITPVTLLDSHSTPTTNPTPLLKPFLVPHILQSLLCHPFEVLRSVSLLEDRARWRVRRERDVSSEERWEGGEETRGMYAVPGEGGKAVRIFWDEDERKSEREKLTKSNDKRDRRSSGSSGRSGSGTIDLLCFPKPVERVLVLDTKGEGRKCSLDLRRERDASSLYE